MRLVKEDNSGVPFVIVLECRHRGIMSRYSVEETLETDDFRSKTARG